MNNILHLPKISARISLLVLLAFALTPLALIAQRSPVIEWQRCLGGSGMDGAAAIQQTPYGGYVVAGNTSSSDGDV